MLIILPVGYEMNTAGQLLYTGPAVIQSQTSQQNVTVTIEIKVVEGVGEKRDANRHLPKRHLQI